MRYLNPTLWRTCRVLSGTMRIRLLRQLFEHPGRSVSELAKALGISCSDASQELRRLQSRGLLQSERRGAFVIYRPGADPQVKSAAPLLKALAFALAAYPPERDGEICRIAFGLAYPRRIALAKALQAGPQSDFELAGALRFPGFAVFNHLRILQKSGFARRENGRVHFHIPTHPLASALVRLLRTA